MIEAAIQFPNIDPAALTLPSFDLFGNTWGPFHLRWYALAYIVGLVLGWRWMVWLIRRDRLWTPGKPALNVPQADDFLFWATLGVILGGRLGYVLFYMLPSATERAKLAADLFAVFRIWEGGMSFHGGFIGVLLAAVYFTYNVHVNFAPRFSVSATPRKHVNEEQFAALAKKRAVAQPSPDKRQDYVRVRERRRAPTPSICCASAISRRRRRPSASSSAASPTSSTASSGAGRPTRPGAWCSAMKPWFA
jgi:phosphatidylglycerol:prolipoprotein diacylglycerol transferase